MRILISACLLGLRCRYDGGEKGCEKALALAAQGHELVPVCPEQLGGLPTPRTPCERVAERVISKAGEDRTAAYALGAEQALRLYETLKCDCAILKARSPMCGHGLIYDGTFSGTTVPGDGVLAELLTRKGVQVYTEDELDILDL
ncbi:MAG: DUF523 domain-containing protein [Clostridia bacterium]|nr:DUF523 domain-containing protein [Clostridia bacterium]